MSKTNAMTIQQVRGDMTAMRPELAKALPEHVTVDRFERVTLTALQKQPDLLQTTRQSLFSAVTQCASDGLIPDGKEAALVKFSNQAVYMPMVAGLLKLARQSGEISTITGKVVYEADRFNYWIDEHGEHLSHAPELVDEPGKARAVYAMARTDDGATYVEVMRLSEIERVRKSSRNANAGPWKDWWDQMAIKAAIRRLFKRLPRSTDRLDQAVHRDDQLYPYDVTPDTGAAPKAEQTVAALTGQAQEEEPEPEREPGSDDDLVTASDETNTHEPENL